MFRRQTDQVYEMLQQVQRRMTSPGEQGSSWSSQGGGGHSPTAQPSSVRPTVQPTGVQNVPPPQQPPATAMQPLPTTQATGGAGAELSEPLSVAPVGHQEETRTPWGMGTGSTHAPSQAQSAVGTAATRRPGGGIGIPVASVLLLCWILTVAVAYLVGRNHGEPGSGIPAAGLAPGEAGQRPIAVETGVGSDPGPNRPRSAGPAPVVDQRPTDFLVLKSSNTYDAETYRRWQADADRLNEVARQDPANRLPPLFGVRRPKSGGLQFVYGYRDGRFGIDRDKFAAQAALLRDAKYKDAYWFSP